MFFCDHDYAAYRERMAEWCMEHVVEMWAYCLMPNHIQLIPVARSQDALARAIGKSH